MATLMSSVLTLIGISLAALGFWMRAKATQAALWPSAHGIVTESFLDDADNDFISAHVNYSYAVDEVSYESKRISFNARDASRTTQEALVSRYAKGMAVTVFYDPITPDTAVLENDVSPNWQWVVMTGAALGIFPWIMSAIF